MRTTHFGLPNRRLKKPTVTGTDKQHIQTLPGRKKKEKKIVVRVTMIYVSLLQMCVQTLKFVES
jgi:hypothetical protein